MPCHTTQVFRYCLALNFRDEYRVHDDIFALLHDNVQVCYALLFSAVLR